MYTYTVYKSYMRYISTDTSAFFLWYNCNKIIFYFIYMFLNLFMTILYKKFYFYTLLYIFQTLLYKYLIYKKDSKIKRFKKFIKTNNKNVIQFYESINVCF